MALHSRFPDSIAEITSLRERLCQSDSPGSVEGWEFTPPQTLLLRIITRSPPSLHPGFETPKLALMTRLCAYCSLQAIHTKSKERLAVPAA
ncbi:unnamed protein product, partial [Iphiclides podalirius]